VNQNNVQTNPMWKFWGQAQKKIKGQWEVKQENNGGKNNRQEKNVT